MKEPSAIILSALDLEADVRKQEEYVTMLSRWNALPHIQESAQRELARLKAVLESMPKD